LFIFVNTSSLTSTQGAVYSIKVINLLPEPHAPHIHKNGIYTRQEKFTRKIVFRLKSFCLVLSAMLLEMSLVFSDGFPQTVDSKSPAAQ
jgi:hypothetical protein